MDLRKLKTLIDLVAESDISELEITEAEGKVRIVKSTPVTHVTHHSQGPAAHAVQVPATAPVAAAIVAPAPVVQAGQTIKSPMATSE